MCMYVCHTAIIISGLYARHLKYIQKYLTYAPYMNIICTLIHNKHCDSDETYSP